MRPLRRLLLLAVLMLAAAGGGPAWAWGDEGHRVIGLVAQRFLEPEVRSRVDALLAADADTLTEPDLASRTTWADRWRDSDRTTTRQRYLATRAWHFADVELDTGDLNAACFGHPGLPAGVPASQGPARACVVDKVEQFAAELADAGLPQAERILALKFLLHLVGDLHQPLHVADNHDQGGNTVLVVHGRSMAGERLHAYWDTTVVQRIGRDPVAVAAALVADFGPRRPEWSGDTPRGWAAETFEVGREVAYRLPRQTEVDDHGMPAIRLDAAYERTAVAAGREQLAKAGFRLAALLNQALR